MKGIKIPESSFSNENIFRLSLRPFVVWFFNNLTTPMIIIFYKDPSAIYLGIFVCLCSLQSGINIIESINENCFLSDQDRASGA